MNTTSSQALADSLKSYSIDVQYWELGAGDSHVFLGHREFLQAHIDSLTAAQRALLAEADRRVLELAAARYEDEQDDDVLILRLCANVIEKSKAQHAA